MRALREGLVAFQESVCRALEALEPTARFTADPWKREGGGGGDSRVLEGGEIFERAGVNFSEVFGLLPEPLATTMSGAGPCFRAMGVSIVLHPKSPMVPIVHANYRVIARGLKDTPDGDSAARDGSASSTFLFGGGSDLTPCYLFDEDAAHFHRALKRACDPYGAELYPRFKRACDDYFFLPHRGEHRGVGGIFFDQVDGATAPMHTLLPAVWESFLPSYLPIVERRRGEPYGERERAFQLWRRGRYAEFNLLCDRGTAFGLATKGRTESILMSLPPLAAWRYDHRPQPDSREGRLMEVLTAPRDWA